MSARYTNVAILLHWLIALGILCLIAIGLAMTQLRIAPMLQFKLYQLHKSIGITVLLAAALRVLWRLTHRPPPLPASLPAAERRAAEAMHHILYIFLFALPLSGWAVVSASPFDIPTVLYSLVPWPDLPYLASLHDKGAVEPILAKLHAYGAWGLIALLAIHAGPALRHHFIRRDDILRRMLPSRR